MIAGGDMARGKYEFWLADEGLTLLEGWAREGLTDEQIAHNMGISTKTLYDWKNKYGKICESLKRGKEIVDFQVENALLQAALDGNTTAQIFWLKNRKKDKWRDKPEPDKNVEAMGAMIKTLADIIEKPVQNRDIKDFEEE